MKYAVLIEVDDTVFETDNSIEFVCSQVNHALVKDGFEFLIHARPLIREERKDR